MSMTIRDAREHELDAVSRVMLAAYEEYMPAADEDVTPEYRSAFDAYRVDIGDVRSRAPTSDLIVAADGDEILGAVTFYRPNAAADYPGAGAHEGWPAEWASFRLLAVDPPHRGRGVGKALTEKCIERARTLGAPVLGLHTTMLMNVARAMYERMGWVRVPQYDFFPIPGFTVEAYKLDL